jgi:hypothetical protein
MRTLSRRSGCLPVGRRNDQVEVVEREREERLRLDERGELGAWGGLYGRAGRSTACAEPSSEEERLALQ